MRFTLISVLAASAVACGGRGGAATVGNRGTPGTLAESLRTDIGRGGAVAIVPGPTGLRAISADGSRTKMLVEGAVPWALVDDRLGVVWFGNPGRDEIRLLDLDGPTAAPGPGELMVANLPTDVNPGGPEFGIAHGEPHAATSDEPDYGVWADLDYSRSILPEAVLQVGSQPGLHGQGGILDMWGETATFTDALAKATLPGRDRMIALAKRAKPWQAPPEAKAAGRVTVDTSNCEDESMCGEAQEIPGTKLWRVVTSYACGDGCYTEWGLYDPAKQALVPGEWAQWLSKVVVAPDGSAFVRDGLVVRFDSGPIAATPVSTAETTSGGGWLDGGFPLDR